MTPQERQLVDDLFDRLSKVENAPRDPEAAAAIAQGLRKAPNAVYALVQTVLLQDEALKRAHDRIQELEGTARPQTQSGGFLDSMRETIFGQGQPRGSVPNVRPPETQPRGLEQRPGAAAGAESRDNTIRRPTATAALWRAATASDRWRRRRLVSRNRGGGGGRRGRRIAAARQHPLDDGRPGGNQQSFGDTAGHGGGIEDQQALERSIRQRSRARCRDQRHRFIRRSRRRQFARRDCSIQRFER